MYPIRSSQRQEKDQRSLDPSPKNDAPKEANHIRQIYDDGMIDIGISTSAGTRLEMSRILEHAEPEPEYSAEAIDRGEFGALYHPATGQLLANLILKQEPVLGYFVFADPHSETMGWSAAAPSNRLDKQLPRIGNSLSYTRSKFPLPHWLYDPWTGAKLRK